MASASATSAPVKPWPVDPGTVVSSITQETPPQLRRTFFERSPPPSCPLPGLDFPKIKRDRIDLHALGLVANIGVPEEERAVPQRLEADVALWPRAPLAGLNEDLSRTINYYDVAVACRSEALRCERLLIETLAEDLCQLLLRRWPLALVRVRIHKFILPDTRAVSVTLTRQPADFADAANS